MPLTGSELVLKKFGGSRMKGVLASSCRRREPADCRLAANSLCSLNISVSLAVSDARNRSNSARLASCSRCSNCTDPVKSLNSSWMRSRSASAFVLDDSASANSQPHETIDLSSEIEYCSPNFRCQSLSPRSRFSPRRVAQRHRRTCFRDVQDYSCTCRDRLAGSP